jgi:acetylornithine deacetylase/succinyl-diaminopimelate desuccinylase-like protein
MDVRAFVAANAAVFVAVGLDADRIHAPNEYVDLSRLLLGAEELAATGASSR